MQALRVIRRKLIELFSSQVRLHLKTLGAQDMPLLVLTGY